MIEKRINIIIRDEFEVFVKDYPMLPKDILTMSPEDVKLDINSLVGEALVASTILTAASLGLLIGLTAVEGGVMVAGGLAVAAIGPLAALTGGAILLLAIPFIVGMVGIWSRDDVLNGLTPAAFKSYSENTEFRGHLKSFAKKAFDIAADKYYNKIGEIVAFSE